MSTLSHTKNIVCVLVELQQRKYPKPLLQISVHRGSQEPYHAHHRTELVEGEHDNYLLRMRSFEMKAYLRLEQDLYTQKVVGIYRQFLRRCNQPTHMEMYCGFHHGVNFGSNLLTAVHVELFPNNQENNLN